MKTFAILFCDPHLAYAPTVLNLLAILRKKNRVHVIAPPSDGFTKLKHPDVQYVDLDWSLARFASHYRAKRLAGHLGLAMSPDILLDAATYVKVHSLRNALRATSFDRCIVIDPTALWIAQSLGMRPDFLSLELFDRPLSKNVDYGNIRSFCIQSQERMAAGQFGRIACPIFFVPNSTMFKEVRPTTRPANELLFCGTATPGFGIYTCLHFLHDNPQYTMTLQGTILDDVWVDIVKFWPDLLETGRLIIKREYIEEDKMLDFIVAFRIGLCIYDMRFKHMDNNNYMTAPSGKLWKYLAAGVPVVGSDIPGLSIVRERNCGVLISSLKSNAVASAIQKIESDYAGYQSRAIEAARDYSFDVRAAPYVSYLAE